jgi:hypothetical protein
MYSDNRKPDAYLLVVLVRSNQDPAAWFVVTARDMTTRERTRYHRK